MRYIVYNDIGKKKITPGQTSYFMNVKISMNVNNSIMVLIIFFLVMIPSFVKFLGYPLRRNFCFEFCYQVWLMSVIRGPYPITAIRCFLIIDVSCICWHICLLFFGYILITADIVGQVSYISSYGSVNGLSLVSYFEYVWYSRCLFTIALILANSVLLILSIHVFTIRFSFGLK